MRLDLFLKWSRVVLRRTIAKQLCDAGRVAVNQHESGAGRELRVGDTVEIDFPRHWLKFRVLAIPPHAPGKEGAREMIEVIEERRPGPDIA
jgi:ribosomal 50S subunit-recycling heat shock protein